MTQMLTKRHRNQQQGVLSCNDRVVITDTLPGVCYAQGIASFLDAQGTRVFDHACFAGSLRERIRARAGELCSETGIETEHINKPHVHEDHLYATGQTARAGSDCASASETSRLVGLGKEPAAQGAHRQQDSPGRGDRRSAQRIGPRMIALRTLRTRGLRRGEILAMAMHSASVPRLGSQLGRVLRAGHHRG